MSVIIPGVMTIPAGIIQTPPTVYKHLFHGQGEGYQSFRAVSIVIQKILGGLNVLSYDAIMKHLFLFVLRPLDGQNILYSGSDPFSLFVVVFLVVLMYHDDSSKPL